MQLVLGVLDSFCSSLRNKLNGQTLLNCSFEESAVASDEFGPLLALPRSDTEHKHSVLAGWTKGWDPTFQKSFLWAGLTVPKKKKKKSCWEGTTVQVCLSPFIKEGILQHIFLKKDGISCPEVEYVSRSGSEGRKEELQESKFLRFHKLA